MSQLNYACDRSLLSRRTAGVLLVCLLIAGVPIFVRMPVWCDVTHYDLCARNLLRGGVHYRDTFDTNLPGMVWLHVLVRSLLGWSSEAIRVADFAVFSGIVCLLAHWLKLAGQSYACRRWTILALFAFYLSTSEHCHGQRDVWMLLPALLALHVRQRRLVVEVSPAMRRAVFWGAAEGGLWGLAFWIKPFVAVPALVCWLVSTAEAYRNRAHLCTRRLANEMGVLVGGSAVVGIGVSWLWWSGAWPFFWDVIVSWNRDYLAWSPQILVATLTVLGDLKLWFLIHAIAIPVALVDLYRLLACDSRSPTAGRQQRARTALLSGLYLGWLFQAAILQQGFVYHHVPAVLLALAVLASRRFESRLPAVARVCLAASVVGIVVGSHPLHELDRLSLWRECMERERNSGLQDKLALCDTTDWHALLRVADYLRAEGVSDGQLTCYSTFTTPLYVELDVAPSSRYIQLSSLVNFFPHRRIRIHRELAASPQRYLVTDVEDLMFTGRLTHAQALATQPGLPLGLPPEFPPSEAGRFPWNYPVVFRAGRYFVHRVVTPAPGSSLTLDDPPANSLVVGNQSPQDYNEL